MYVCMYIYVMHILYTHIPQGMEDGINREATQALMLSSKLTPTEQGNLRTIQAGGLWTQDRRNRAGLTTAGGCPFCSAGTEETLEHIRWHCRAWKQIRDQYPNVMENFCSEWPRCLLDCGIRPEGVAWKAPIDNRSQTEIIDLTTEVMSEDSSQPNWAQAGRGSRYGELEVNGYTVVFTDGVARRNQCKRLRFAGYGAFWKMGIPVMQAHRWLAQCRQITGQSCRHLRTYWVCR